MSILPPAHPRHPSSHAGLTASLKSACTRSSYVIRTVYISGGTMLSYVLFFQGMFGFRRVGSTHSSTSSVTTAVVSINPGRLYPPNMGDGRELTPGQGKHVWAKFRDLLMCQGKHSQDVLGEQKGN
mmetsp:Transcript_68776/g.121504  ORF Transcript_68776/g.121504 Transcript_68776/m.121504 type:complete len:126 (-) Transcript_68776:169-546(-)